MTKTCKMVALMSLPATAQRKAVAMGEPFEAAPQERLDLLQAGRAADAPVKQAGKTASGEAT